MWIRNAPLYEWKVSCNYVCSLFNNCKFKEKSLFIPSLANYILQGLRKFRQIVNIYIFSKSHLFKKNLVSFNTKNFLFKYTFLQGFSNYLRVFVLSIHIGIKKNILNYFFFTFYIWYFVSMQMQNVCSIFIDSRF